MKEDQRELIKKYKVCFGTEAGIQVLNDLEKRFYHKRSYTKSDKEHTFFNEGRRDVVLLIKKYVDEEI